MTDCGGRSPFEALLNALRESDQGFLAVELETCPVSPDDVLLYKGVCPSGTKRGVGGVGPYSFPQLPEESAFQFAQLCFRVTFCSLEKKGASILIMTIEHFCALHFSSFFPCVICVSQLVE